MNTKITIAGAEFKNPVMPASGTFGFGWEFSKFYDISALGGICTKGVSLQPRLGNNMPRIAETSAGMLNSVGLQNPGVEAFINEELPFLREHDTVIIVNIFGNTIEECSRLAEILSETDIDMIELNISCPNVSKGGVAFGTDEKTVRQITSEVKRRCDKPLIVKLSPNVTDIAAIARAAEEGGADALSLINTILAMRIDVKNKRTILNNNYGGLSGPAVKAVALRMVHQVYNSVKIPIIGMGGIMTGEDAVEFMLAGATAVAVGTANIVDPFACIKIIDGIEKYMTEHNVDDVKTLTGGVILN